MTEGDTSSCMATQWDVTDSDTALASKVGTSAIEGEAAISEVAQDDITDSTAASEGLTDSAAALGSDDKYDTTTTKGDTTDSEAIIRDLPDNAPSARDITESMSTSLEINDSAATPGDVIRRITTVETKDEATIGDTTDSITVPESKDVTPAEENTTDVTTREFMGSMRATSNNEVQDLPIQNTDDADRCEETEDVNCETQDKHTSKVVTTVMTSDGEVDFVVTTNEDLPDAEVDDPETTRAGMQKPSEDNAGKTATGQIASETGGEVEMKSKVDKPESSAASELVMEDAESDNQKLGAAADTSADGVTISGGIARHQSESLSDICCDEDPLAGGIKLIDVRSLSEDDIECMEEGEEAVKETEHHQEPHEQQCTPGENSSRDGQCMDVQPAVFEISNENEKRGESAVEDAGDKYLKSVDGGLDERIDDDADDGEGRLVINTDPDTEEEPETREMDTTAKATEETNSGGVMEVSEIHEDENSSSANMDVDTNVTQGDVGVDSSSAASKKASETNNSFPGSKDFSSANERIAEISSGGDGASDVNSQVGSFNLPSVDPGGPRVGDHADAIGSSH